MKQGKQNFMGGRFKEAEENLRLATKLLKDKDKLIDAYLHLALSHFALGETDQAKEDLARLLRINPTQEFDLQYYPPDFVKLLDDAKEMFLTIVKIETIPSNARVFLDGKLMGTTPLELAQVAPGEHKTMVA